MLRYSRPSYLQRGTDAFTVNATLCIRSAGAPEFRFGWVRYEYTDEGDSRCWNFIQIAETTHVRTRPYVRERARNRRFLLASTSRKFSPPTRPPPSRVPPSLRVNHRSPRAYIPGDQCTWQSAPFKNHHRSRRFHGDRVLSCTNDCALSTPACQSDFRSSRDGYKSCRPSHFADLIRFTLASTVISISTLLLSYDCAYLCEMQNILLDRVNLHRANAKEFFIGWHMARQLDSFCIIITRIIKQVC